MKKLEDLTIEEESLFTLCDCHSEGLLTTHFDDEFCGEFWLSIFRNYQDKPNIWERIKYAAWHLWTGKRHKDQMVMNYDNTKNLITFMEQKMAEGTARHKSNADKIVSRRDPIEDHYGDMKPDAE